MMNMDVSLGAALAAAPSSDATCASADSLAGAADAFAALLEEATGTAGDGLLPACEPDKASADKEHGLDDMALMAMSCLLSLGAPIAPPPDAMKVDEIAPETTVETDVTVEPQLQSTKSTEGDAALESMFDVASRARASQTTTPQATVPMTAPEADSEKEIADGIEAVGTAATEKPASVAETPDINEPRGDTEPARKDDAGATSMRKSARGSKSSRAGQDGARHAAGINENLARTVRKSATTAAAAQPVADVRRTERAQETIDTPAPASTAARFARALERAALPTRETNDSASGASIPAGPNNGSSQQQSSFGDGSADRATDAFAAPRPANGGASFIVAAPAAFDARMLARTVDAASHAVETSPTAIPERDVVAQLVQSLRVQFRDGIGEAVVKLKPEHLGSVQVSLKIENGAIKATVQAEVASVRQWLESQQDTLRTSLAEQGLRLERFVVEPDRKRQSASDDEQPREQRRRQQQRTRASAMSGTDHPIFEVTV